MEKSGIESLGVRVSDPGQTITLNGESFGNLVLLQHLRTENLHRCAWVLEVLSRAAVDESELLAKVGVQLQTMSTESAGVAQELLRVAREQGLHLEIVPARSDLH